MLTEEFAVCFVASEDCKTAEKLSERVFMCLRHQILPVTDLAFHPIRKSQQSTIQREGETDCKHIVAMQ